MGRLVTVILVLSFVAQQFACCGVGICTAVCGDRSQTKQICQPVKKSCCCSEHGANRQRRHDRTPDSPVKTPHQHHVCVGTHLFYLTADRFDVADLVLNSGIDGISCESGLNLLISNCLVNQSCQHQVTLPHAMAPLRSALCVYRI